MKKINLIVFCLLIIFSCSKKTVLKEYESVEPAPAPPVEEVVKVEDENNSKGGELHQRVKASSDCIEPGRMDPGMKCDPDPKGAVCGCNNKTYKNACEAEKAGVARYKYGPCVKTAVQ